MAGNAIIGALRVVIGADSAALDKGLKDAQSSLARFSGQIKNIGLVAAGALAGVVGGTAVAIRSALTDADKLGKLAQSVGLPVEELSKLKYAAELSDISLESLGTSLVKLSKNMSEVAGGNKTGAAAQAFKVLGINVRDASGQVKSSDTILAEVADRFAEYRDGANKTAIAVALFGRAGAAMIPMLNQGSAALREQKNEAAELGLVIDKQTASAAEAFNDNLTRLHKVMGGVAVQIAAQLAPGLESLSNWLVEVAKNGELSSRIVSALHVVVVATSKVVATAAIVFNRLASELAALWNVVSSIGTGGFATAWDQFRQTGEETNRVLAGLPDLMRQIEQIGAAAFGTTSAHTLEWTAALKGSNDAIREAIALGNQFIEQRKREAPALPEGGENALQTYLQGIAKRQAALQAEMQTIGMSEAAQESLKIKMEALTIAKEKGIEVDQRMAAQINATAASFGQLSQAVQEARLRWSAVEGGINTVASGLTDIAMRTKTAADAFRDMATSIIRDITQMIIKALLLKAATSFMSSLPGSGVTHTPGGYSPAFPQPIGSNAMGTDFWRGGPTWVGERGPEIVDLPRGARVTANDNIMPNVNVNVHNYGSDNVDVRPKRRNADGSIDLEVVVGSMVDRRLARGDSDAAMSRFGASPTQVRR